MHPSPQTRSLYDRDFYAWTQAQTEALRPWILISFPNPAHFQNFKSLRSQYPS